MYTCAAVPAGIVVMLDRITRLLCALGWGCYEFGLDLCACSRIVVWMSVMLDRSFLLFCDFWLGRLPVWMGLL